MAVIHPDIQPEIVPCHSDMICCVSMQLAQNLSSAGHLLGPLSRCWPGGKQGWICGDRETGPGQIPALQNYMCKYTQAYRLG